MSCDENTLIKPQSDTFLFSERESLFMKRLIILLILMGIVATSGCIQQVTCNKPYIKVGKECCLDINDNAICDKDETTTSTTTTSTTTTTTTTEPSRVCNPCFEYFTFVEYSNITLKIRNGPKTIRIESAISRPGGASTKNCLDGSPCGTGADIYITGIPKTTGIPIAVLITYTDMGTGFSHTDTAIINNS